jgi:hypothetical protein
MNAGRERRLSLNLYLEIMEIIDSFESKYVIKLFKTLSFHLKELIIGLKKWMNGDIGNEDILLMFNNVNLYLNKMPKCQMDNQLEELRNEMEMKFKALMFKKEIIFIDDLKRTIISLLQLLNNIKSLYLENTKRYGNIFIEYENKVKRISCLELPIPFSKIINLFMENFGLNRTKILIFYQ